MVVSDGSSRLVNQNDCRTSDLDALTAHGPVDLHWLQYSGAIWYPMVYDMPDADKRVLCEAKVESQFARAMRYVEAIGARAVVPSAGPPVFLDDELFHLNMIRGDELSIFPDQRAFLARLERGRTSWPAGDPRHHDRDLTRRDRRHPSDPRRRRRCDLRRQGGLPRPLPRRLEGMARATCTPAGTRRTTDLLATLKAWWEPLLGDGADAAERRRRQLPVPGRRPRAA